MLGDEALRRWSGVPLMTLLSFPSLGGIAERHAAGPPPLVEQARYCRALGEGVYECAVVDARDPARQLEWVITPQAYERLPAEQRGCWRKLPSGEWARREPRAEAAGGYFARYTPPANDTMPPVGSGACP